MGAARRWVVGVSAPLNLGFSSLRDHAPLLWMALRRSSEGGDASFTESDREQLESALDTIRRAMCQPQGLGREGMVGAEEYDWAMVRTVCCSMRLWLSGRLDEVRCDGRA